MTTETDRKQGLASDEPISAVRRFSVRLSRFMTIYSFGLALQLGFGLATTILVVRELPPASYGRLGLYLLVPSFVLVVANVGLLQGTNRAILGAAEGPSDPPRSRPRRRRPERQAPTSTWEATRRWYDPITPPAPSAEVNPREDRVRVAMGTGLILSLSSGTVFAGIAIALAPQIASLLGNVPHGRSLVVIGAISGALAGGWRLTSNAMRYARRPVAWVFAHTSRAAFSLVAIIVLLGVWHSLRAVIVGFAIGTLLGFALSFWLSRRYVRIAFDRQLANQVLRGAVGWVPIVLAYYVILSMGIYFVSLSATKAGVGLWSLASSLAVPAHYLVSSFLYSSGPLRRSALRIGVVREVGETTADAALLEGFFITSAVLVLLLGVFARELLLIAPRSYAGAAALIPVIAVMGMGRGYFAFTYVLSVDHDVKRFRVLAVVALGLYLAMVFPLSFAFKAYGVAGAGILAFAIAGTIQLVLGQRSKQPLPLHFRRIIVPILLTAIAVPAVLAPNLGTGPVAVGIEVGVVFVYLDLLLVTRVLPAGSIWRELKQTWIKRMPTTWELRRRARAFAPGDVGLLRSLLRERRPPSAVAVERSESESLVLVRFVSLLRRLADVHTERPVDPAVGSYLLYRGPYGERDRMSRKLVMAGTDPVELDELEQVVDRLSRLPRRALRSDDTGLAAEPITVAPPDPDALTAAAPWDGSENGATRPGDSSGHDDFSDDGM